MREEEFLERVNKTAVELLKQKGVFEDIVSELKGGKQVRPRTIYNLIEAISVGDKEKYVPLATATEVVHLASLFHDDVIDNGTIRRGRPTLNVRYGNLISILAGDYFYSSASQLVLENYDIEVSKIYSHSVSYMTRMELRQAILRWNIEVSEDEYFDIIRGKTGALFSASFESIAVVSGLNQRERLHFREAGMLYGEIFQLIDDLLDFVGTETGKNRLKDLSEGYMTLPAIYFIRKNTGFSEMVKSYFMSKGEQSDILYAIQKMIDGRSEFLDLMNGIIQDRREKLLFHLGEIGGFNTELFMPRINSIIERKR